MNQSQSFDRAESAYDQTRPLPEPAARRGIQAILDISGSEAVILDAGTGTGRISVPLLERGARLIGCDLSVKMLRRLQGKFSSALLAQADIAYLPFRTDYFDALLTVHVMHLVGPWRQALREFWRVVKPGGAYLNIRTYEPVGVSVREQIRTFWRSWVTAQGCDVRLPGVQNRTELLHELNGMGANMMEIEVVRYPHIYTLQQELERYQNRVYSETWKIPHGIYEASLEALRSQLSGDYDSLDRQIEEVVRFAIDVVRFEG